MRAWNQRKKNLTEIAEHWFNGDQSSNEAELEAKAAALNIQGYVPAPVAPVNCYVWPEHEDAAQLFLRCDDQWRTSPSGYTGIDMNVAIQMARIHRVKNLPKVLDELKVISIHAVSLMNKEESK